MRIKKLEFEQFTTTFDEALRGYMGEHPETLFYAGRILPTLNKSRGKIVILDDFESTTNIGVPWGHFRIEDTYMVHSATV